MATPRRLLVNPSVSGVFHCVSRCVRRAFLCGRDAYSGRDYEHRRYWIRDRLRALAELFAIEVCAYAVMTNHVHTVLRTLPEQAKDWSDEEVARRWLTLFPGPGGTPGRPPESPAIELLSQDAERLEICRERLADLSWFMRCLNEPIARRANREDECKGRFWEGRFQCQRLEDEGAILACMIYVDLNPVRAGIAESLEESDLTSAQDRIVAGEARRQLASAPKDPTPAQAALIEEAKTESTRDGWLTCIGLAPLPPNQGVDPQRSTLYITSSSSNSPQKAFPELVENATPLLPNVSEEAYLELADWTGRQIRHDKRGRIDPHLRPILERLDLKVEAWVDNVARYGGLFHRLAGKLDHLREQATALGRAWLQGCRGARQLYAQSSRAG